MTAPFTPEPASGPLSDLDSTAQLATRFTAQLQQQLREAGRRAAHTVHAGAGTAYEQYTAYDGEFAAAGDPVLVCVTHGSRDPGALRTTTALLALVRKLPPGLRVLLGRIELTEPLLSDALAAVPADGEAVLVPLLFGCGHHVERDIPQAAAAARQPPRRAAAPVGAHPALARLVLHRYDEARAATDAPDSGRRGARQGDRALAPSGSGAPVPNAAVGRSLHARLRSAHARHVRHGNHRRTPRPLLRRRGLRPVGA